MKSSSLRWAPGLFIIAGLSAATVTAVTLPVRRSIAELDGNAADLAAREASAVKELTQLLDAQAGAVALPAELLWSSSQSASVEIALQETLVAKAGVAGLQLVSFSEAAPLSEISSPTLASDLELVGTHEELATFLASLEDTRPALAISYIWLRQLPPDQTQAGSPLTIRMTVWGFRAGEDLP